jgi:ATP-dependent RNA helicase DDX19/DBP5
MSGWGEAPKEKVEWGKDPVLKDAVENLTEKVTELSTEQKEPQQDLAHTTGQVQVTLADKSQLYTSANSFEDLGLSPDLLKGVYSLGYTKPSKIQATALPLLLSTKNMIGQSQAGTGKTACFSLTILSRMDVTIEQPQALVLAPARELARQILDNIRALGKYTSVTTQLCVPGSVGRGEKVTQHVVVGTPGTIQDLIKKRQLATQAIKIFVLDEADSMLDQQGLGDSSLRIKK